MSHPPLFLQILSVRSLKWKTIITPEKPVIMENGKLVRWSKLVLDFGGTLHALLAKY